MLEILKKNKQNGIVWLSKHLKNFTTPEEKGKSIENIANLISNIKDKIIQDSYVELLTKELSLSKEDSKNIKAKIAFVVSVQEEKKEAEVKKKLTENSDIIFLEDRDEKYIEYYENQFLTYNDKNKTGYYFPDGSQSFRRMTNFTITPLFHLMSSDNNRRMAKVSSFHPFKSIEINKVIELPANAMAKLDTFKEKLLEQGPFFVGNEMNKQHFSKLTKKWIYSFPICHELKTLGWQTEGFFAYSNKVFNDTLKDYNEFGAVEIGDKYYLSPSAVKNLDDTRGDDNLYENDKFLSYVPAKISFRDWAEMIDKVYGANGRIIIAFAIATIFLDVVKKYTNMPLLYPYGAVESGKSALAESLSSLFFNNLKPFNLSSSSTDFAFYTRLERFSNCPAIFNEFDESAIKDEWFRAFKGLFDDESREKGIRFDRKTRVQKVRSSVVIVGQYLSTKDDNSVLSRSIPCLIKKKEFTGEEIQLFNKLKSIEKDGLSGLIIEVLQYRKFVEENFKSVYEELYVRKNNKLKELNKPYKTRILKSYSVLSTVINMIGDKMKLSFKSADFEEYCINRVVELSIMMTESNALADFWKTVEFLVDRGEILENLDFKIRTEVSVGIYGGENQKTTKHFEKPKKILFIRLGNIFRAYSQAIKRIGSGKPLNEQTLLTYLKEQTYWIGVNPAQRFEDKNNPRGKNTSSIMLDYDAINTNLESEQPEEDNRVNESFKAKIFKSSESTTLENKLVFTTRHIVEVNGQVKELFTRCFVKKSDKAETDLREGNVINLYGMVATNNKGYRSMDVEKYRNDSDEQIIIEGIDENPF